MAFPTGQFVPPGYVPAMQQMQQMPQMLPQIQPSMQFHPSMLANPMATPQFTATPLKQPIFPRQAGVQQYDHSDSEISDDDDDDLDEDSDFDEPPELEPETMQHRTFLQATQFQARSRSGERGRSRSIPRERHASLPPQAQNPYQSRFSQQAVRQFLATGTPQQAHYPSPFTPQVALPPTLPNFPPHTPHMTSLKHIPQQPEVIPVPKLPKLKRSKSQGQHSWEMIPNHQWARYASKYPVMNPSKLHIESIRLHPLLSMESCRQLLSLNVTRPPATLTSGGSIQECISEPATAPPVNQLHLWTGVHGKILTITNPMGVTVGNVLGIMGDQLFQKLPKSVWRTYGPERQEEVGNWFWHNRKHALMPPVEKGVMYADLLGGSSMFAGLMPVKQNGVPKGTFAVQWASAA